MALFNDSREREILRRIRHLEQRMEQIAAHLGLPPLTDAVSQQLGPEFEQALLAGKKIQAIKIYRQATRSGLTDAKNDVERIARDRGLG